MDIRFASKSDVKDIEHLIANYARQNLLLPVTEQEIKENISDYVIGRDDSGSIVGCATYTKYSDILFEIRSLAVVSRMRNKGVGREMVETLIAKIKDMGAKKIFALTYSVGFFEKLGFSVVPKETLPEKIWKVCVNCPKFEHCDEIAVVREYK